MEQFIVSARKYRPVTFESVVGQDTISTTLKNAIRRRQLAHAYLFCGPRGVGKTTCARIFAKTINCLHPTDTIEACDKCESCRSFAEGRSYSIHELDAASNNSVDDIRKLTDRVRVPPQIGKYSVYIIDEVHMLSPQAFNAFLKTLEEPPAHAIFILATTEKHKIIPTILSRCQIYDFNRISIDGMVRYLKVIAQKEQVTVEDTALNIIAQKADGAMRDALSIFDQAVVFCGHTITYEAIIKNLHVVDYKYYFALTDHFLAHRYTDALLLFDEVLAKGFDALHFIAGLSDHFRNLLVCKDAATIKLFESGDAFKNDYLEQTSRCTPSFLFSALGITNTCEMNYKSSGNPRLHVELTLMRLSYVGVEKGAVDTAGTIGAVGTASGERSAAAPPPAATAPQTTASRDSGTATNPPTAAVEILKPVETVKPVETAAPSKPSKPLETAMPPSFSLKDTLSAKAKTSPATAQPVVEARQTAFTPEQLQTAWRRFVASIPHKPRLMAAVEQMSPTLTEQHTVHITLLESQKWVADEATTEIVAFLREELHNDLLELAVTMETSDNTEKETPLYSPSQQWNYLNAHYPAVEKLRQNMELDIK
ncbi:MAG: DNA polymerase III subunit gamma/tau [Prevotellaceae bacterium]|jgi:DNA polymerase-3 subunit gamma/tau|nr:DNA polymerase III subunit gamma/tau [Prevotellaceae bacterium]